MAQFIENFPYLGTEEERELWFQRFAEQYNQLVAIGTGGGAVTGGDLEFDPDTGEITAEGGSVFIGYAYRYLHVRFASDPNGVNQITNLNTYTGNVLYVGLYNSVSNSTPPIDANFVYNTFAWASGHTFSFVLIGGRDLRFDASAMVPADFTQISVPSIIDLEQAIASGAAGRDSADVNISVRRYVGSMTVPQLISAYDAGTLDPWDDGVFQYDPEGMDFATDTATKILVAETRVGGILDTTAARGYTYEWDNAAIDNYTPSITGQTLARPFLFINLNDLGMNSRSVQFLCNVTDGGP